MTQNGKPRILTLDIETSPNRADVWQLFKQTVSLSQLHEVSRVICFAAKWEDSSKVLFYSDFHDGHAAMIAAAYELLEQADILVHYNGDHFDVPHLNREFLLGGYGPPAPSQSVDLLKVVRKHFRFTSNKLDHIAQQLGVGSKVSHSGHKLWVDCMNDDPGAWARMRKYNKGDVRLTEEVYHVLKPWIANHPHMGLYSGVKDCCSRCGSINFQRRGSARTGISRYPRIRCNDCGGWGKLSLREGAVTSGGLS